MEMNTIEFEGLYSAQHYAPLPVVLTEGRGAWLWDEEGRKYLDLMGAYSASSFGHSHPRLVAALKAQAERLDCVSRAYFTDRLGPFLARACSLTGMARALPMNSGAEAVETALKAARKWAYEVKGVPEGRAKIIACEGNFHGRTIAILAMSSEAQYRQGFGPFPPGFELIPYGDREALKAAIDDETAAFLVEPIQGEGGIRVPPSGYLRAAWEICRQRRVLLLADEIQTGLGRTGRILDCWHEGISPDGLMLGKALGGGLLPISLFLAQEEVMNVFRPGDHGSTFGGNPIAAAVGLEALHLLEEEDLAARARELGDYFIDGLRRLALPWVKEIRGRGLLIGIEVQGSKSARERCLALLAQGILSKETHHTVLRIAPPLIITRAEIDWALERISQT